MLQPKMVIQRGISVRHFAVASALVLLAACGGEAESPPPAETPAPVVEVAAVAPLGPVGQIEASGLIAYKRETPLAFNVPGVVASLTVDEGQTVAAGQRLAALRQTQVAAGSAEAQAALETAERNLSRTRTLFEGGWVTQARLDDAELAVRRAQAASARCANAGTACGISAYHSENSAAVGR